MVTGVGKINVELSFQHRAPMPREPCAFCEERDATQTAVFDGPKIDLERPLCRRCAEALESGFRKRVLGGL